MRITILSFVISIFILFFSCSKENGAADSVTSGKGGSLARFTTVGNYLYIADHSGINVFDINDPMKIEKKGNVWVGFGIETIFPYKDKLFIGSVDGMYIYSLENPVQPKKLGEARHLRSCDPVVANDSMAYVTLRGGNRCGPATDGLYTYNITNITAPAQKSLLPLTNPYGLGLVDTVVFVCRGNNGLTAVDVKQSQSPKQMYTLKDADYFDVIPYDKLLICYVNTGILLYDVSNLKQPVKMGSYQY
ncbi:MAG TPA: hypothetical protein VEY32_09725 [Flavisolibacter sp.]|nr:hypothetical protein [Flavisolibacter sp.]